jgi:SynChlorMet cassette radical SAM/SPASM protein ScmE
METLVRLAERYPGRIQASAGPLAEARMWGQMEAARNEGSPVSWNGGRLSGCGCPSEKIAVRADGTIVPCAMLAHLELGLINRDSLTDVWQRSAELNHLRTRQAIPLSGFAFCAGCGYAPYCTGNCPGLAYTLTGQVNHPSPDACLRKFLAEGGQIPTTAVDAEKTADAEDAGANFGAMVL